MYLQVQNLCEKIQHVQLVENEFDPQVLQDYLKDEALRKHFGARKVQHTQDDRNPSHDSKCDVMMSTKADQALQNIVSIIKDAQDGLESYETDFPGKSEQFIQGHLKQLLRLCNPAELGDEREAHVKDQGEAHVKTIKNLYRDAGELSRVAFKRLFSNPAN